MTASNRARNVDGTLVALADPARRAMVGLLSQGPRKPSEIANALSTTRPAVSRHLRVLRNAGLVVERVEQDDARFRTYELRPEPLENLRSWLDEVEAFWTCQLKVHAEKSLEVGK